MDNKQNWSQKILALSIISITLEGIRRNQQANENWGDPLLRLEKVLAKDSLIPRVVLVTVNVENGYQF